jgi:hypothetical protein
MPEERFVVKGTFALVVSRVVARLFATVCPAVVVVSVVGRLRSAGTWYR